MKAYKSYPFSQAVTLHYRGLLLECPLGLTVSLLTHAHSKAHGTGKSTPTCMTHHTCLIRCTPRFAFTHSAINALFGQLISTESDFIRKDEAHPLTIKTYNNATYSFQSALLIEPPNLDFKGFSWKSGEIVFVILDTNQASFFKLFDSQPASLPVDPAKAVYQNNQYYFYIHQSNHKHLLSIHSEFSVTLQNEYKILYAFDLTPQGIWLKNRRLEVTFEPLGASSPTLLKAVDQFLASAAQPQVQEALKFHFSVECPAAAAKLSFSGLSLDAMQSFSTAEVIHMPRKLCFYRQYAAV